MNGPLFCGPFLYFGRRSEAFHLLAGSEWSRGQGPISIPVRCDRACSKFRVIEQENHLPVGF